MTKLQEEPDGTFRITVPKDIVEGKGWKKGAQLGFCIADNEINRPLPGDIFLRRNR